MWAHMQRISGFNMDLRKLIKPIHLLCGEKLIILLIQRKKKLLERVPMERNQSIRFLDQ